MTKSFFFAYVLNSHLNVQYIIYRICYKNHKNVNLKNQMLFNGDMKNIF